MAALIGFAWNSITRGTDDTAIATLVFTVIAAASATVGTVATFLGNRVTSAQQRQIANDISRLAELTESSIEEARALQPLPLVHFLAGDEASPADDALLVRSHLEREIDREEILANERQRAMGTVPRESGRDSILGESVTRSFARLAGEIGLGPITEEEISEFEGLVDSYIKKLTQWLDEYLEWNRSMEKLFVTHLQFENRGRVPADNLVVQLNFPDSFASWEDPPDRPERPKAPRFKRRTYADMFGMPDLGLRTALMPQVQMPYLPSIEGNVSSPRYRDGSVIVEFEIDKLLHGIPENTEEPAILSAAEDGEFRIPWQIHAENLQEPARGELQLQIRTDRIEGPPIRSLAELSEVTEPTQREEH